MRLLTTCLVLSSAVALAETPYDRTTKFAEKVRAERHRLGLDKNDDKLGTPEVSFVGTELGDGLTGLVCPGESITVKLKKVPPKSLVIPSTDAVTITKESWAGDEWTGTITPAKNAAPRTFGLLGVLGTTGQQFTLGTWLIGCKHTLTFDVGGATLAVKVDLKKTAQDVSGEWKKGGKSAGTRSYHLNVSETGLTLNGQQDAADSQKAMGSMQQVIGSPKWKELEKRQEASMKKIEACAKQGIDKMQTCMKPVEAEMKQLATERDALMAEAEKGASIEAGCLELVVSFTDASSGRQCAGQRAQDELPLKWSWTSP